MIATLKVINNANDSLFLYILITKQLIIPACSLLSAFF